MAKKDLGFVETFARGSDVIFVENSGSMIEIDEKRYADMAAALKGVIGESEFFCGSINYECGEFYSTLTATLLIYRCGYDSKGGGAAPIRKVVPVWWEFSTLLPDGSPVPNDFSFGTLKKYILTL